MALNDARKKKEKYGEKMKKFSVERIEATFALLADGRVSADHAELHGGRFQGFDEFEAYMLQERGPIWIEALIRISGCRAGPNLWEIWVSALGIFRKFHANHMEWIVEPKSCPPEVRESRERELGQFIDSLEKKKQCHWKRNHEFICFCDEIQSAGQ